MSIHPPHEVDQGLEQQRTQRAPRNWTKFALITAAFVTMAMVILAAGVFLVNSMGNHAAPAPVTATSPAASLTYQTSPPTSSAPAASYTTPADTPAPGFTVDPVVTRQLTQFFALNAPVMPASPSVPDSSVALTVQNMLDWAALGGDNLASPYYYGVCAKPLQSDSPCQLLAKHGGLNINTTTVQGNLEVPTSLSAQATGIRLSFKDNTSMQVTMTLDQSVNQWWFIKEITVAS